jgi:hypothetical protein
MRASTRIYLIGFLFWLLETGYFGWNALPQSPAEVICDGIAALIVVVGLVTRSAEGKSERTP